MEPPRAIIIDMDHDIRVEHGFQHIPSPNLGYSFNLTTIGYKNPTQFQVLALIELIKRHNLPKEILKRVLRIMVILPATLPIPSPLPVHSINTRRCKRIIGRQYSFLPDLECLFWGLLFDLCGSGHNRVAWFKFWSFFFLFIPFTILTIPTVLLFDFFCCFLPCIFYPCWYIRRIKNKTCCYYRNRYTQIYDSKKAKYGEWRPITSFRDCCCPFCFCNCFCCECCWSHLPMREPTVTLNPNQYSDGVDCIPTNACDPFWWDH